jgi:hypothetical protein
MTSQIQKADQAAYAPSVQNESAAMMTMISKAATDPSFDVSKLEKLLEMKERMDNKQAQVAFNAAMARMQADIPSIAERGTGHNIVYATYEDILDVVRPIMHKHGFALSFKVDNTADAIKVTGVLMHQEGHDIETSMALPSDTSGSKNKVQALGSSTSYGKRYVLCALLNIATRAEDDNGFAAVPDASVTVSQAATIQALLDKCKDATVDGFTNMYGDATAISKGEYNKVMAQLTKAVARDSVQADANN